VAQLRSRSGPEGEGSVFVAWVGSIWVLLLRVSGEKILRERMEETGRGLMLTLHLVYRVYLVFSADARVVVTDVSRRNMSRFLPWVYAVYVYLYGRAWPWDVEVGRD
jgi:hypothetical protein